MDDAGLLGIAVAVAIVLAVGAVGTGAYLYASDWKAEATVQEDCAGGSTPVKTKLFGIEHTVTGIPAQQCLLLKEGAFVEHRVRSKHTTLYEYEGGRCVYDTIKGPFCGQAGRADGLL